MKIGRIATGVNDGLYTNTLINVSFVKRIRYAHTFSLLYETYTLLAAGFCVRWPKACAMGLRWLRPAAFDYGKKLAANNEIYAPTF